MFVFKLLHHDKIALFSIAGTYFCCRIGTLARIAMLYYGHRVRKYVLEMDNRLCGHPNSKEEDTGPKCMKDNGEDDDDIRKKKENSNAV